MQIEHIDINKAVAKARAILAQEKNISMGFKAAMEVLFVIITLLTNRFNLNSKNSSKPPSSDPNREKQSQKNASGKKPGGQPGHNGNNLKQVTDPDEIQFIAVDKASLPEGKYHEVGYDARQVIDIRISRHVIEYRAQILTDKHGNKFAASFPEGVVRSVQYGSGLKAHVVYLSQFQLLPYNRISDYFAEEVNLPLSMGSIYNFNAEAYKALEEFAAIVKQKLIKSKVLNVDETGINVNGKNAWLHLVANEKWTYFYPHSKRGSIAMNDMEILPYFKGTLCHDHWKPYFIYQCSHALCNAHHLRELQRVIEQDQYQWADKMQKLLLKINVATKAAGGQLAELVAEKYYRQYREIIKAGEKECPSPKVRLIADTKKRGQIKKSFACNLLERLKTFEKDTLRFMQEVDVPFTNNLAENNIRMTKVQQKISGCFRSMNGAHIFARIRSYISTCRKHDLAVTSALQMLFQGKMPNFIYTDSG